MFCPLREVPSKARAMRQTPKRMTSCQLRLSIGASRKVNPQVRNGPRRMTIACRCRPSIGARRTNKNLSLRGCAGLITQHETKVSGRLWILRLLLPTICRPLYFLQNIRGCRLGTAARDSTKSPTARVLLSSPAPPSPSIF
jgi:hypothetical protein